MTCRRCIEYELSLEAAMSLDTPERRCGLTEIGERNRMHQYTERVAAARLLLDKHKARCPECLASEGRPLELAFTSEPDSKVDH